MAQDTTIAQTYTSIESLSALPPEYMAMAKEMQTRLEGMSYIYDLPPGVFESIKTKIKSGDTVGAAKELLTTPYYKTKEGTQALVDKLEALTPEEARNLTFADVFDVGTAGRAALWAQGGANTIGGLWSGSGRIAGMIYDSAFGAEAGEKVSFDKESAGKIAALYAGSMYEHMKGREAKPFFEGLMSDEFMTYASAGMSWLSDEIKLVTNSGIGVTLRAAIAWAGEQVSHLFGGPEPRSFDAIEADIRKSAEGFRARTIDEAIRDSLNNDAGPAVAADLIASGLVTPRVAKAMTDGNVAVADADGTTKIAGTDTTFTPPPSKLEQLQDVAKNIAQPLGQTVLAGGALILSPAQQAVESAKKVGQGIEDGDIKEVAGGVAGVVTGGLITKWIATGVENVPGVRFIGKLPFLRGTSLAEGHIPGVVQMTTTIARAPTSFAGWAMNAATDVIAYPVKMAENYARSVQLSEVAREARADVKAANPEASRTEIRDAAKQAREARAAEIDEQLALRRAARAEAMHGPGNWVKKAPNVVLQPIEEVANTVRETRVVIPAIKKVGELIGVVQTEALSLVGLVETKTQKLMNLADAIETAPLKPAQAPLEPVTEVETVKPVQMDAADVKPVVAETVKAAPVEAAKVVAAEEKATKIVVAEVAKPVMPEFVKVPEVKASTLAEKGAAQAALADTKLAKAATAELEAAADIAKLGGKAGKLLKVGPLKIIGAALAGGTYLALTNSANAAVDSGSLSPEARDEYLSLAKKTSIGGLLDPTFVSSELMGSQAYDTWARQYNVKGPLYDALNPMLVKSGTLEQNAGVEYAQMWEVFKALPAPDKLGELSGSARVREMANVKQQMLAALGDGQITEFDPSKLTNEQVTKLSGLHDRFRTLFADAKSQPSEMVPLATLAGLGSYDTQKYAEYTVAELRAERIASDERQKDTAVIAQLKLEYGKEYDATLARAVELFTRENGVAPTERDMPMALQMFGLSGVTRAMYADTKLDTLLQGGDERLTGVKRIETAKEVVAASTAPVVVDNSAVAGTIVNLSDDMKKQSQIVFQKIYDQLPTAEQLAQIQTDVKVASLDPKAGTDALKPHVPAEVVELAKLKQQITLLEPQAYGMQAGLDENGMMDAAKMAKARADLEKAENGYMTLFDAAAKKPDVAKYLEQLEKDPASLLGDAKPQTQSALPVTDMGIAAAVQAAKNNTAKIVGDSVAGNLRPEYVPQPESLEPTLYNAM